MNDKEKIEVIKNLKHQKEKLLDEYRKKGFEDGKRYVEYTDYETLLFVWNVVVPNGINGRFDSCSNSDVHFRDYLDEMVDDDDFLLDKDVWSAWSNSWVDGFKEAWLEIKAEL